MPTFGKTQFATGKIKLALLVSVAVGFNLYFESILTLELWSLERIYISSACQDLQVVLSVVHNLSPCVIFSAS